MESSQSSRLINDEAVAGDVARFLFLISTMNGRVESFMIFWRPVPQFRGNAGESHLGLRGVWVMDSEGVSKVGDAGWACSWTASVSFPIRGAATRDGMTCSSS